jgi:hypothetical protein
VIRTVTLIHMKVEGKPQKYLSGKMASEFDIKNMWLNIAGYTQN